VKRDYLGGVEERLQGRGAFYSELSRALFRE